MAHLKQQARENLQKHIHETIPSEYQKGMIIKDKEDEELVPQKEQEQEEQQTHNTVFQSNYEVSCPSKTSRR
jgi:hypothetical protein